MTILLKISVNGGYRATIKHSVEGEGESAPVIVDGNPGGPPVEQTIQFWHGKVNTFVINEEPLPVAAPVAA